MNISSLHVTTVIMSVGYYWVLDRHGNCRTFLGCDDLGGFLINYCRNKESSNNCFLSASRILTTNKYIRYHLFPQLHDTLWDSIKKKGKKNLNENKNLNQYSMLQLKIKGKVTKRRLYEGNGIWYKSRKSGKILGEDIHKERHRDMENERYVLRMIVLI